MISKSEICLVIVVLFFATVFMGCVDSPGGERDLSLDLHEFQYDTESINLAADNEGNLHTIWQKVEDEKIKLFYIKMDNDGDPVMPKKLVYSADLTRRIQYTDPAISMDSKGNAHVVFEANNNLFYCKLSNDGKILEKPLQITHRGRSTDSNIAVDLEDNLNIVWTSWVTGKARIYYMKLDSCGKMLIDAKEISEVRSYDPTIVMDSKGGIHISWYYEDTGAYPLGLYLVKMDLRGNIVYEKNMAFPNVEFRRSSIELMVNSKDQTGLVYTLNNRLKYFPAELLDGEHDGESSFEEDFRRKSDCEYYLELPYFTIYKSCFINITMIKGVLGRCSGDILLSLNDGEYTTIGSWSFGQLGELVVERMKINVTQYITSDGVYRIKFEKDNDIFGEMSDPEILSVKLISEASEYEETENIIGMSLSENFVLEPSVAVDSEDCNNFVWYDDTGNHSQLHNLKTDYYGNIIMKERQITLEVGRLYDPAVVIDKGNCIHLVWLDEDEDDTRTFYMKMDGYGKIMVPAREIKYVEKDESTWLLYYIMPVLVCVITVSVLLLLHIRKIRKNRVEFTIIFE